MADCVIDYCEARDEKILIVTTDDATIRLGLCGDHSTALRDRLAQQLGVQPHYVDLTNFGGTIGELQQAIDYLDGLAAAGNA